MTDEEFWSAAWIPRLVASQYARRFRGETADVYQDGYVALLDAHRTYRPSRGVSFQCWALHHVRCALIDLWRVRGRRRVVAQTKDDLARGAPVSSWRRTHLMMLDAADGRASHTWLPPGLMPAMTPSPEDLAIQRQASSQAREAVRRLPQRARTVVQQRFWQGQSLEDIGRTIDRSPSRVSQILRESYQQMSRRWICV